MYLSNGISSVLIERKRPHVCDLHSSSMKNLEGPEICSLDIVCSSEIRLCILGSRCFSARRSPKWIHVVYIRMVRGTPKVRVNRSETNSLLHRRGDQNLRDHQDLVESTTKQVVGCKYPYRAFTSDRFAGSAGFRRRI